MISCLWNYFSPTVRAMVDLVHAKTDIRVGVEKNGKEISFIIYPNLPYTNKDVVYFTEGDDMNKLTDHLCRKLHAYLESNSKEELPESLEPLVFVEDSYTGSNGVQKPEPLREWSVERTQIKFPDPPEPEVVVEDFSTKEKK